MECKEVHAVARTLGVGNSFLPHLCICTHLQYRVIFVVNGPGRIAISFVSGLR